MMNDNLFEIKKNKNSQDFLEYLNNNIEDYLPAHKNYYSYYYYISSLKEELGLDNSSFNILMQKVRNIALS